MDLEGLVGETIVAFSFVELRFTGIENVLLELSAGNSIGVSADEVHLGGIEAHALRLSNIQRSVSGTRRMATGWQIGSVRVLQRQEWIESVDPSESDGIVGSNPRLQSWGPVGSVPGDPCIVDFAIALRSTDRQRQALISLADYPGLLEFSTDAREVEQCIAEYGQELD